MDLRCWLCSLLAVLLAPASWADEPDAAAPDAGLVYEQGVAPLFRQKCVRCHNPKTKKAGLDLTTPWGIVEGGESGVVVEANHPEKSLLWEKLREGEMPPEEDPLSKDQLDKVRRWIASGAKFRNPPRRRERLTQHNVIPILLLRCAPCHGADRKEAGLDLRTRAALVRGGKSGPAAIPGKPEQSPLVKRVRAEEMPPRRKLVSVSVKPMTAPELKTLEEWIRQGMPEASSRPIHGSQPDTLVSDEHQRFWSFQPPKSAPAPCVNNEHRVKNPIDGFVLSRLELQGLTLSPEADRAVLLRRLSIDLLGLPPTPQEVERFLADSQPSAYERLVERLLASPRYGERYGQHWLDAAGYADSEGAQNEDRMRPHIYRYRDYVIQAFNRDKPYDRFLREQIAGDELADAENASTITHELYDNLVATGFLRTAPDRTFADITNFVPERLEVIADEIDIFGSAVLGLTIKCARCHSHKFDPIPQRDYYRLAAIFKDAYDEHDWLKSQGPRTLPHVTAAERERWKQSIQQIDQQIEPLKKQLASEKNKEQKKTIEAQIKALQAQKKPEPRIRALWSRGRPSPTYLLKRGDYLTPGPLVAPGPPSVLTDGRTPFTFQSPWPGAAKTGRRLALANWITKPDHPLTARVMVNRIWKHHFGVGIVRSLDNFGKTGEKPSHPKLLDWLAGEFVRSDWSIKAMHRLIVTSSTYRQSSRVREHHLKADPDGRLLSRMPLRRMEAEVLRDCLLSVSGSLHLRQFGPADPVEVRDDGLVTSKPTGGGWRRTIYVLHRRTKIPTILENYDYPEMGPNCISRSESLAAPQALHLLNNSMVHQLAEAFAQRVRRKAGSSLDSQVRRVYAVALSRSPSNLELGLGIQWLRKLQSQWSQEPAAGKNPNSSSAAERALANYCHAIMNSAEFLYID